MTEPGWNDPPMFSYESLSQGGGGPRKLTKRPLYPADKTTPKDDRLPQQPGPIPKLDGPPKLLNITNGPPPVDSDEIRTNLSCGEEISNDFGEVLRTLERQVERLQGSLQRRTVDEIQRRLSVLSQQWGEGKLSPPVQGQMARLAAALERGDCSEADSIHVALMVDHVSEVSQWMVGVKKLIAAIREQT